MPASPSEIPEITAEDYHPPSWEKKLYSGPVDYYCYKRAGFASSRWFKRGWTLQELLAPSRVHFHDRDWRMIGTRFQLGGLLADITKIQAIVASHPFNGHERQHSIAGRFSWASNRETTREEDVAYCLLGIFNVHLLHLYGEGETRAFIRLQDEIIKRSTDHSIWFIQDLDERRSRQDAFRIRGQVLASGPKAFQNCGDLMSKPHVWNNEMRGCKEVKKSYALTNYGLYMELPLFDSSCPNCQFECQIAILDCWTPQGKRLGIHVAKSRSNSGQFERVHCDTVAALFMDLSGLIDGKSPDIQKILHHWTHVKQHLSNGGS